MSIDANDPRITAFVFGELEGPEREQFVSEMEGSTELREIVEKTKQTLDALEGDLSAEPSLNLSEQQRTNVIEQIEEKSGAASAPTPSTSTGNRRFSGLLVAMVAVAALGLFAVAGVAFWYGSNDSLRGPVALVGETSGDDGVEGLGARGPEEQQIREQLFNLDFAESQLEAEAESAMALQQQTQALQQLAKAKTAADAVAVEKQNALMSRQVVDNVQLRARGERLRATREQLRMWESRVGKDFGTASGANYGRGASLGGAMGGGGIGGGMGGMGGMGLRDGAGLTASRGRPVIGATVDLADSLAGSDSGVGPGQGGDQHELIVENEFLTVGDNPLSTFSIDVDTAAYSKIRMYLLQHNQLPRRDAVRIEELLNYFPYSYEPPTDERPFAARMEIAQCPWNNRHRLLRVAIKGKEIDTAQRPSSNLVFLLDVSGSMKKPNKLPLLRRGMKMLVDQLNENDHVAIVVYAGAAGLVLDSTNGDQKADIVNALERLRGGGSTNGGEGIHLAYQTAMDNYIKGGVNRVILCTDGDFNVGITGNDTLTQIAERNAKTGVFLSVLGFGMGNHNDAMLESISNKGNGNYAFIDSDSEARKVLVEQMSGTLVTIAKDVKIQVEFNPAEVGAYRLIGYENRMLAAEDFNNDKKDAGEIGAGHNVTALYELVPTGKEKKIELGDVDALKYQKRRKLTKDANNGELLTLKLRYKEPDGDKSKLIEFPLTDEGKRFGDTDKDFRFAASVAAFGMLLRNSPHKGDANYDAVLEIASEASSDDESGYRSEFINIVNRAKMIAQGGDAG